MGVKGLQRYIEEFCPDVSKTVSIENLAIEHKRKLANGNPVVVIDGLAFMLRFFEAHECFECILGGQFLQFKEKLKEFIERFRQISVDLVFFFDGVVETSKRLEWVKRRVQKVGEIKEVLHNFNESDKKSIEPFFVGPTGLSLFSQFCLKELGVEVYMSIVDADVEIAEYASENAKVFGILAQDSDFVIFDTKLYLSLKDLDFHALVTTQYDRNVFAQQYLQLTVQQLPLFSCLVGNDFISRPSLRNFHSAIRNVTECSTGSSYLEGIANTVARVIRVECKNNEFPSSFLRNVERKDLISLKEGIAFYEFKCKRPMPRFCIDVSEKVKKAILDGHRNCIHSKIILNLFVDLVYDVSELFECDNRTPASLVYRDIRRRCYEVAFGGSRSKVVVKEWCAYFGNSLSRPDEIRIQHTGTGNQKPNLTLEDLWFNVSTHDRLVHFLELMGTEANLNLLLSLPKSQLVLCSVLKYLIQFDRRKPIIQPWEVAVIVAQSVWAFPGTWRKLEEWEDSNIHPRISEILQNFRRNTIERLERLEVNIVRKDAISLCTLFNFGLTLAVHCLSICNYPFPVFHCMPWNIFDGKLFHHLYTKKGKERSVRSLCQDYVQTMKEFHQVLRAATNNTQYEVDHFNWTNVLSDFQERF